MKKTCIYLSTLLLIMIFIPSCRVPNTTMVSENHEEKIEEGFFLESPDTTWRQELFPFPIRFASDINYEGVEDARFPVGWEVKDSSTFWSYVFAWKINRKEALTVNALESDLQKYFNGLMGIENTDVILNHKDGSAYNGQVKTKDSFFSKEPMILHVDIKQKYCKKEKQLIILFQFTPRNFSDDVWAILDEVKIAIHNCQF